MPPSITRKTRLNSIIRLTRPTSLDRMASITSTNRETRLARLTSMVRMTSYPGILDLKVWTGRIAFLCGIVISELITPVLLGYLAILLILSSGVAISPG